MRRRFGLRPFARVDTCGSWGPVRGQGAGGAKVGVGRLPFSPLQITKANRRPNRWSDMPCLKVPKMPFALETRLFAPELRPQAPPLGMERRFVTGPLACTIPCWAWGWSGGKVAQVAKVGVGEGHFRDCQTKKVISRGNRWSDMPSISDSD